MIDSNTLSDDDEIMLRQIHPSWLDGDAPSSIAFSPSPKDAAKLSVDRQSMATPQESYDLFKANGNSTCSVYGISIGEFREEKIICTAAPTSAEDGKLPNPAHALADYSGIGTSQRKLCAKRLKQKALNRGRLHP